MYIQRIEKFNNVVSVNDQAFSLQLSDAISIIGREDFPEKWPTLLTDMISKIKSGNFHVINGVLRTAHSVFKRYVE